MRYLLFLAIVLMAIWLLRSGRRRVENEDSAARAPKPPPPDAPQEMVRCGVCGTHLPHSEAIVGRVGVYCSQEHRQIAEP